MRSTIQPGRRASLPRKVTDDLVLHLKYNGNLDDSSYWDQTITKHNESIVPSTTKVIDYPAVPATGSYYGKALFGIIPSEKMSVIKNIPSYHPFRSKVIKNVDVNAYGVPETVQNEGDDFFDNVSLLLRNDGAVYGGNDNAGSSVWQNRAPKVKTALSNGDTHYITPAVLDKDNADGLPHGHWGEKAGVFDSISFNFGLPVTGPYYYWVDRMSLKYTKDTGRYIDKSTDGHGFDITNGNPDGDFTIEFWARPKLHTLPSTVKPGHLKSERIRGSAANGGDLTGEELATKMDSVILASKFFVIGYNDKDGYVAALRNGDDNTNENASSNQAKYVVLASSYGKQTDGWDHVALVKEGATVDLLINGAAPQGVDSLSLGQDYTAGTVSKAFGATWNDPRIIYLNGGTQAWSGRIKAFDRGDQYSVSVGKDSFGITEGPYGTPLGFVGHLDNIRITNGIARYPTYPDSSRFGTVTVGTWYFGSNRWVPPSNFPDFGSDDISNELYTAFFEGGTYVNYKPKLDDLGEFEDVTTDYNFVHGTEPRCRAIEALAYDFPNGPQQIGNRGTSRTFGNSDYIVHSSRDGQGVSRIFIITISPYSFANPSNDVIYYQRSGTSSKDMHGLTSAQLAQWITLIPKTEYAEKRKCVGNFCYNVILSANDAGANSSNPIYNTFSKINSSDGTAEQPGVGNRRQDNRITNLSDRNFRGVSVAPRASRIKHEKTLFDGRLLYVYVNGHPKDYIMVYFMGRLYAGQSGSAWPTHAVDNSEIPSASDIEFVTTGLREEDGYEKWETMGFYPMWKPTLIGNIAVTDNLLNVYGNTNVVVNKGVYSYLYDLSMAGGSEINIITHRIGPAQWGANAQQNPLQEWTGNSNAIGTRLDDVLVASAYDFSSALVTGGDDRISPKITPYMFNNDNYVFLLDDDSKVRHPKRSVQELNIFKIQSDGQLKKIKTENLRKSSTEDVDVASNLYTYVKGDYLYVHMRRWDSTGSFTDKSYTDVYEVSDNGLRKVHDGIVADYTVVQVVGNYLATVSNTFSQGLSAASSVESNHKLRNTYDNISYTRLTENPQSLLVSGSGVYSTDPLKDSAEELNFDDDFCIEGYVKFNKIPEGSDEDPGCVIFDWGNLKLSNTSGFWSVQAPDGDVVDYFDPDHIDKKSWKYLPNRYIHFAVQRREDNLQLWLDDANLGTHAVDPNTIPNQFDSTEGYLGVNSMGLAVEDNGNNQFNPTDKEMISGISGSPYNSARSIGSTVSGTNFFTGIMRDFKVWDKAVYGPVDVLIGKQPSAEGIHGNGRNTFYYYYYNQLRSWRINNGSPWAQHAGYQPYKMIYAYDGDSITLSCTYTSVIDPRYSVNQPLPVLIQWYHNGQFIGDSQNGVSVNSAKHRINSMGKGELTVTNIEGNDQGYYDARVSIGPFNRPKYTWYSYFIGGGGATNMGRLTSIHLQILQHPKPPPPPKAVFTMFSCNIGDVQDGRLDPDALGSHGPATRGPLQLGDDAEMLATFYPYNQPWASLYRPPEVLPPGPMDYVWSKKGRGQQNDKARVFAGSSPIPNGRNYAWPSSSLRFTNVRKSIKGPICVEAFDANGVSHGKVCCAGLNLRLPDLVKIQSRVTPIPSASSTYWELLDYKKSRGWRYGYWNYNVLYKNLYSYTIRSIGQFASASLTLGPVASDPNVAELNTGGIEYKWRIYGYDDGVLIDETTAYSSSDTTKTYNITDNFNGNIYCYMQYVNYPANQYSDDPEGRRQWGALTTVQWTVGLAECVEPSAQVKSIAGATQRAKTTSANWWDQFFYGTEYTRKGLVENLPKDRESETEELTVFYRGCEDVVVPIGYWDANNVEIQNVRTELATDRYIGVTNSITFDSSIWTDAKYVPHPTFWNRAYYAAQRPAYLVLRGTITSARHGTTTEIVLNNECGQRKIKIKFHSYSYRPPAASPVSTIRYFYLQKRLTYSWTGQDSNGKPIGGNISERTDTSPNYIQCYGYLYNYNPCYAWRTRLVGPHNSGGWSDWNEKAKPYGIMVHHGSDYVTLIDVNMYNSGSHYLYWYAKIYANALPGTTEDCTFEVQISSSPAIAGDWDNGTKATNSYLIKRIERPTLLSHTCGSGTAIYNGKGPWWGCFGGSRRWTTPRWWWRPYWYWRRSGHITWRRYYPYYVRPRLMRGGLGLYSYRGYSVLRGGRSSYFAFRR